MLLGTHLIGGYIVSEKMSYPQLYVILGAILPDIVDKPLGIMELTSHYHSFGHSIIFASMVLILSIKYSPHILALTIGWITHVFMDAFHIFINRGIERTTFMFYPFMFPDKPEIQNGTVKFASNFWSNYIGTTSFYLEFVIWGVAITLLYMNRDKYYPYIVRLKNSLNSRFNRF